MGWKKDKILKGPHPKCRGWRDLLRPAGARKGQGGVLDLCGGGCWTCVGWVLDLCGWLLDLCRRVLDLCGWEKPRRTTSTTRNLEP